MPEPQVAPYGSWKSPITSDLIVSETVGLGQITLVGADTYWVEQRPSEGGRNVVVRRTPDGTTRDVTPKPFNARNRVHEYGGGAYAIMGATVVFSHYPDQRLYRQDPGAAPHPITPEVPEAALRYADGMIDRRHNRMICVREDHRDAGREAVNTIVSVKLDGDEQGGEVIVSGEDFYSNPRLSPDGAWLCWLTWNHPNMPWDGTELWVVEINADGSLGERQRVAGGPSDSIFQPEWSPDGDLYFVSDRTGWWNLYRWRDGQVEPLTEMQAEFGEPQWVFGMTTYGFESAERAICTYTQNGTWFMASLDTRARSIAPLQPINLPYSMISDPQVRPGQVVFIAGSPTENPAIIQLDLTTGAREVLRRSSNAEVDVDYISIPEAIEFPTENGLTAYGFYYPPKNGDFLAPPDEKPPLLVHAHGGPTGSVSNVLRLSNQFWTSRGFAVLEVNYGGSTGYGRAYRQRLDGQWGVVDVDDCINGARYLVARGDVDPKRLIIAGGSAGGYTTLAAVAFRDVFHAGASYFGLSELALSREAHKFESHDVDRFIGPYPERADLFRERSPLYAADRVTCPVIFFQGLEDEIVLPNQTELMVEAMRAKGLPVAYIAFEGEQHGFRKAENIKRSLDAELYFYSRVFGFELAEPVAPVQIENL
jgi:dipeptidyl aminopeptidase/acylaminoacyl peptidase